MVTWKRDGEYVNLDQRIHIGEETGNLIIQRLFKEDEGKYQCIVSNMAGSRESNIAKLHVRRKTYLWITTFLRARHWQLKNNAESSSRINKKAFTLNWISRLGSFDSAAPILQSLDFAAIKCQVLTTASQAIYIGIHGCVFLRHVDS